MNVSKYKCILVHSISNFSFIMIYCAISMYIYLYIRFQHDLYLLHASFTYVTLTVLENTCSCCIFSNFHISISQHAIFNINFHPYHDYKIKLDHFYIDSAAFCCCTSSFSLVFSSLACCSANICSSLIIFTLCSFRGLITVKYSYVL